ncbi:MAG: branched-chain amino acid ABC transporter ATP-binding protein/permease [Candidatus Rokubacteria bacterium]|nr:branched-chain amino acid ABC transporter ATP-binding protein/permease [Candidatus Rokubacteria bacterium]
MLTVWAVELGVFALVIAAILAERPVPLGLTLGAGVAAWAAVRFVPGLRAGLARAFTAHRRAAWLGGAVLAVALPFALRASPYWTFVATMALLYVTIGQGLNFQIGTAGVINLAGAAFAGLGGYTVGLLTVRLGAPPLLALLAGPLVAVAVGAVLFVPILKTRGHYLALVTIAFGFIFTILMNNLEFTGGPQGIKDIPTLRPFGFAFSTPIRLFGVGLPYHANFYWAALALAGLATLAAWRLHESWLGLALNTLRDDEIAARCSGVHVARQKLVAFSIGNLIIGVGGAFYAVMVGFVSPPDFDFGYSLIMLSVIILGGVDSIPGIVLGACLLIPLPERFRFLHEYRLLLYGVMIVLVLLFRPRGLWPAPVRRYGRSLGGGLRPPSEPPPRDGAGEAGARRVRPPAPDEGSSVSLLETRDLTVRFGGLTAVDGVTLEVREGEAVGLIGPNGSGKTTLFNAVTGLYAWSGDVRFAGSSLAGLEPHAICRHGIARTFQSSRLCLDLSVFDNVLIGMRATGGASAWTALLRRRRFLADVHAALDEARRLLALFNPALPARGFERAAALPQIDRRRVEICRALAARPRLLLLDEPSAGMSPEETAELMRDLQVVREADPRLAVVIIEHDMFVIESVSQRVIAFNYGRKIAEGPFKAVAATPEVREAYLGREAGG